MFFRRREEEKPVFVAVCVNQATKSELTAIGGLGAATADAIISGRPWSSVEDLTTLRGVTGDRIREWNLVIK